jgi:hypothetical protein
MVSFGVLQVRDVPNAGNERELGVDRIVVHLL